MSWDICVPPKKKILKLQTFKFNYIVYEPILNYLVYNEDEQCENVEWVLYPYFKTRGRKCASSWDRLNEQLII